jgi:thioredoxin:protein disulfide reductase
MNRTLKLLPLAAFAGAAILFYPKILGAGPTASFDVAGGLAGGRIAVALGLIFAGGILTAMTPCVFPLIPITLAIFGAKPEAGRTRAFLLALTYTFGMAALFSALGVAAVLGGKAFGSSLGNPWLMSGIAIVLVALSLSMFGIYEITVPAFMAARLQNVGGAGFAGAFGMGLVAGVLAAPCTGPVLSAILVYVATIQSVPKGAGLLFVYALGVGVPFVFLATFSMKLPKSGPWMDAVKSVLGLALVSLAFSYVRDAFPDVRTALEEPAAVPYAAGARALAVAFGVLIGAINRSFHGSTADRALKLAGTLLVVAGASYRAAAASGGVLEWTRDLDSAVKTAAAEKRPVLIDFFADWCEACKELDRKVYPDARVQAAAKRFVRVKIDGTNDSDALDKLYERYGVQALPTVTFVDSKGTVLKDPKVTGYLEPEHFVAVLSRVE